MRQSGIAAAPAIYALEHNVKQLNEDIEHTKLIHDVLCGKLKKIRLQDKIQTNILMLDLSEAGVCAEIFCARAKELGLLIRPVLDDVHVRLVVYKGITREDSQAAAEIILQLDAVLDKEQ